MLKSYVIDINQTYLNQLATFVSKKEHMETHVFQQNIVTSTALCRQQAFSCKSVAQNLLIVPENFTLVLQVVTSQICLQR